MASSRQKRPRSFKWLAGFAALLLVAFAAHAIGWHYAAGRLMDELGEATARLESEGARAECEGAEATGYPLRIGLRCASIVYADAPAGFALSAGALRSTAPIHAPRHVTSVLEGPATLGLPDAATFEIGWEALRAEAQLADPAFEDLDITARAVTIAPQGAPAGQEPAAAFEAGAIRIRPVPAGTDVAVGFERLSLSPALTGERALPPLSGNGEARLDARAVAAIATGHYRGSSAEIGRLELRTANDETAAVIAGPLAVDAEGLIDARLELTIRNPEALAALLAGLFPEWRDELRTAMFALAALGDTPSLPLAIEKSEVSIGFITLGALPPVPE